MMSYKKTLAYFIFQAFKYAGSIKGFKQIFLYYPVWKKALDPSRNSMNDQMAWLNFAALDFLSAFLKPHHNVFEYGGGGSTIFFLNRAGFVATVEHHAEWFQIIQKKLTDLGLKNWKGHFQEGEIAAPGRTRRIENPEDYLSNQKGHENLSYEKYAKMIHHYPEAYFDVVLVDGRARPSCIAESFSRLKKGGILVVDNMERGHYYDVIEKQFSSSFQVILKGRLPLPYHPDFVNTMIFKKL